MKIRRDYTQPFFREPKSHPLRNMFIAALLGLLLGLAIFWQQEALRGVVQSLSASPPTPTPMPSELATRASELFLAGDLIKAEDLLAKAVAERPNNIAYRYEHGRLLIELDRYDEAYDHGAAITELDARDARGFALKATALTWRGQASVAIPIALSGLESNPRFTPLHATLARAYVDTQRWADGLETAESGLSINDEDAELIRAYAYALQSVGAYSDAEAYLRRAMQLRPTYLPVYFELGGLYLARDDDQSAIDVYNRILSLKPRNARAMLRLCLAYRKVGEFARALGFCQDSVDVEPADAEAQFQLGLLHYRERQFEASRDAFQQCLRYDEGFYELSCRYRLGLSHYYTGACTLGWSLLRDSLDLAQAAGDGATVGNILQGLDAIESDPQCVEEAAAPLTIQH